MPCGGTGNDSRLCGEIAQTYQRGEVNHDRDFYFRVIRLKTAELFEAACLLGAGGRLRVGLAMRLECMAVVWGAYQLFDDLVDLYAEEEMIGKTLGTDLEKGKFTLPLFFLLERLPEADPWVAGTAAQGRSTVIPEFCQRLETIPSLKKWLLALRKNSLVALS